MTNVSHTVKAPLRQRARSPTTIELAAVPWLPLLDGAERERAQSALQVVDALPGDFVCKIGRQANYWFGVLDGLLKMSNHAPGGTPVKVTGAPWLASLLIFKRPSSTPNQ